ncbi:hypothetical protein bcere0009_10430 [Bacillus cereus R309803]|nr:hypothetical protein bcere0009_10430 [Bacillus cereus R309803]
MSYIFLLNYQEKVRKRSLFHREEYGDITIYHMKNLWKSSVKKG